MAMHVLMCATKSIVADWVKSMRTVATGVMAGSTITGTMTWLELGGSTVWLSSRRVGCETVSRPTMGRSAVSVSSSGLVRGANCTGPKMSTAVKSASVTGADE